MTEDEIQTLMDAVRAHKVFFFNPDSDDVRLVVRIGKRRDPDDGAEEPSLCASFPDGTYAALYNCTLSSFMIVKPIPAKASSLLEKMKAAQVMSSEYDAFGAAEDRPFLSPEAAAEVAELHCAAQDRVLRELFPHIACHCDVAFTARKRHEPNSLCPFEDDVRAALGMPEKD